MRRTRLPGVDLGLTALISAVIVVAQACAGSATPTPAATASPSATSAAASSPGPTSGPTAGASPSLSGAPIKIVYWNWKFTEPAFNKWNDWAEATYTKAHPNVTFSHFTPADFPTEIQTTIAGGSNAPDLVAMQGLPYEIQLAKQGLWVNLQSAMDADATWAARTKQLWASVPAQQYVYNGSPFAAPISNGPYVVYYWKDLFAKAGATPPQTLDDLLALPAKFKAIGVTPMAMSLSSQGHGDTAFWATAANVDYNWAVAHQQDNCGQKYAGDAVAKQVLEGILKLYQTGVFRKQAIQDAYDPGVTQLFAKQQAAMMYPAGSWINSNVESNIANVGVMTWPGAAGSPTLLGAFDIGLGILQATAAQKDPAHQAAMVDYLKFLTSADSQQQLWAAGLMPLDGAAAANPTTPDQQLTAAQVKISADSTIKAVNWTSVDPRFSAATTSSINAMLIGNKTSDQVLADFDAACAKAVP